MLVHITVSGETVYSIASRYGVDPFILAYNNDVTNLTQLSVGQPLVVVFPIVTHTVAPGETLFSIAQRYGVTTETLYRNNLFLNGRDGIYPGQLLYISVSRSPIGDYMTGGYAYPFVGDTLLDRTLPLMSALMPFTYGFRTDGTLVPLNDEAMIAAAKEYGTCPVMHLSTLTDNDSFSVALAEALFASAELQEKLIESIIGNLQSKGYYGLDIDFEFLGAANAEAYADFVRLCRERLNGLGYPVLVALAPKTYATQPGVLYEGHDYKKLGEAANSVLLMTYEWGYSYGPPMAVSPINPVRRVVEYAVTEIEPRKIFIGISNYGYDFVLPYIQGLSRANSLSTREAFELAYDTGSEIRYDEAAQAPFFEYSANGKDHIVWFEDARSIENRLRLLPEYGLKGALYWNLNRENNQNLVVINGLINLQNCDLFSNPPYLSQNLR